MMSVTSAAIAAVPEELRPIVDLAAVPSPAGAAGVRWLVLSADGVLSVWQPVTGEVTSEVRLRFDHLRLPDVVGAEAGPKALQPWPRLHVSRCGTWAAVVQDRGRYGAVVETAGGSPRLMLDGGDYHPETVPFALAFAEHGGRTVVVHRSAWNRLDVTDPATGELLTARELADASAEDPEHYLDYFHGALYLSPDGTRLYDDGWVWQPLGVPAVWSLNAWLDGNPYESEDGPTLIYNPDFEEWNEPVVWIREDRLAHRDAGEGPHRPPAIVILDPTATQPGYGGHLRIKTVRTLPDLAAGQYFTDGEHLLISTEAGLNAYDIDTGEQQFVIEGFRPTRQDPHTGTLIQIDGALAYTWTPAAWTPRFG